MRSFEDLVAEAELADVTGWGFEWLAGRAWEERPPWGFAKLVADRLSRVRSALDIDTGGGEVLDEAPVLPRRMVVTESWPPNAERARECLGSRGVQVIEVREESPLPFPDESFELVTARHPVQPDWPEIHRVLVDGGHYFAQHVGPASAFELIEHFRGPLTEQPQGRDPVGELVAARDAGLSVEELRTARCRMAVLRHRDRRMDPAHVRVVGARLLRREVPARTPPARRPDAGRKAVRCTLHPPPHRSPSLTIADGAGLP